MVGVQQQYHRVPTLSGKRPAVRRPLPPVGYDPDVVARASELLRALDRSTTALTDALDVSGFPPEERRSDLALLSTVASGLPAITLDDVVESLRSLATVSGPTALFPEDEATLSLPDESRELLYLVEPLAALSHANGRLPRHAGNRLLAAPLAFSLGQSKTSAALGDVVVILRLLMRLPLRQRALTTIRDRDTAPLPAIKMPPPVPASVSVPMRETAPRRRRLTPRMPLRRAEPTGGAALILLAMLLLMLAGMLVVFAFASGGPLPFGL